MSLPGPPAAYKHRAMRSITMRPEAHKRFTTGHPWVYSNEIVMDAGAKAIEAGSLVRLLRADGSPLALAIFNPHTLIAARRLTNNLEGPIEVKENGLRFLVDPMAGQKTGWFYDQRDNRAAVATLAPGARVLDLYSYTGGFALAAAKAGAREVMAIDRSEGALRFAEQSAALNGLAERCKFCRAEVFEELERLAKAGKRFDIVIADPPAFVKAKKDLNQGARAYRKLARLSAALVKPGGFLFIASCSHNMPVEEFDRQVNRGLVDLTREGRILRAAGAAADHPLHPALPESAYLKSLLLQLD